MARRAPAFQFYVDDFIGGTHYMSASSVGVYVRLLCFQFASGLLPSCHKKLARIAGVGDDEFKECWDDLSSKFAIDGDGRLFNERLKAIVDEQVARSEARSVAGRSGGKAQAKRKQTGKQSVSKHTSKNKAKGEGDGEGDGVGKGEGDGVGDGAVTGGYSTDFLNFWAAFPVGRKKSKGAAWTAWQKAVKSGVEVAVILAKASEYAMSDEGRGDYVKMPSTWLNQNCWEDDAEAWKEKPFSQRKPNERPTGPGHSYEPGVRRVAADLSD